MPNAPEVEETGTTFLENATLKAVAISRFTDALVLADDSGLEVDALGGQPGVYSARFAGPGAGVQANNQKLVADLAAVSAEQRTARFRCVMVAAQAGNVLADFEGTVEGRMLERPRGEAGFGYDPLFVPDGYQQSFAELGTTVKNSFSHRARAMKRVVTWLRER